MFGDDDALAIAVSKVTVYESLMNLLTRDLTFHDLMRELLLVVMKVVKSEAGSILEVDQVNRCLFFRAVVGSSSDKVAKFLIPIGQGVVGHVAESRQPLAVDNVEENRVYLKSVQDAVGFEARNLIAIPIIVRGRVFGVLELLNRVGEENYTRADVDLLTYLCGAISKAVELRLMLAWALNAKTSGKEAA
jgi:GAF domain-containing protein